MPHKGTKETRNRKTGREIIQLCDQVTCSLLFFSFLYSCTHHPFPLNIFVSLCIQMQFLNKHFPTQCPGPGSSQNNSGAAPPAATRWKLPLGLYHSLLSLTLTLCVCVCVTARGEFVFICWCFCMWQSERARYPSLGAVTFAQ